MVVVVVVLVVVWVLEMAMESGKSISSSYQHSLLLPAHYMECNDPKERVTTDSAPSDSVPESSMSRRQC